SSEGWLLKFGRAVGSLMSPTYPLHTLWAMSTTGATAPAPRPAPGVHPVEGGVEAAVLAPGATAVWLCTFDEAKGEMRHALTDAGHGWFGGYVPGITPGTRYGLRAEGPWDPSAGQRFNPA